MITETYKGRKIRVTKGTGRGLFGSVSATVNDGPAGPWGFGTAQAQALADIRAMIDEIDSGPVDGGKWAAHWYAPGTYELCPSGHATAPGEPCRHFNCETKRVVAAARTAAIIRTVPAGAGFRIDTTTIDDLGHAFLACTLCSWYGYHVSGGRGGAVRLPSGDSAFRLADLSQLTEAAASHTCPPEVIAAQAEALALRTTPDSATAGDSPGGA
jgi:hypothetical protein